MRGPSFWISPCCVILVITNVWLRMWLGIWPGGPNFDPHSKPKFSTYWNCNRWGTPFGGPLVRRASSNGMKPRQVEVHALKSFFAFRRHDLGDDLGTTQFECKRHSRGANRVGTAKTILSQNGYGHCSHWSIPSAFPPSIHHSLSHSPELQIYTTGFQICTAGSRFTHKGRPDHNSTCIHKTCTLIFKSGSYGSDSKVEVHVLWIYVMLWCCCS